MSNQSSSTDRRSFLKYAGVAAAGAVTTSLAGCLGDDDDPGEEDTPTPTPTPSPTPGEPEDVLREFDEELPDDPTREEILQHVNGLANYHAMHVFLHQQYSIYGLNDDLEWEARGDEDIIAREFVTDLEEATVTQGTFPTAMDPADHNDTPTHNVMDQPYEGVVYRDRDARIIESIATDWDRIDEHTIEFEIRDGVMFHSGNEMTLEDVAWSINRFNDPEVSQVAGNMGNINEAYVEDGKVVLDLDSLVPTIFINLTSFGRIMEQEWTEERSQGDLNAGEVNGTGAYELVDFADDVEVVFEKFDDYWGENEGPDTLIFDAVEDEGTRVDRLITEESHLVTNVNPRDVSEIEAVDGIGIAGVPSIRSIFLVMNDAKEPFDSIEFRQAMNFAVDVEAIVDSILDGFGTPTSQPTLPTHFGHNPRVDPYGYDPERAEALVEESGYSGAEITVHTTNGRYLRDTDVAETAAEQINELDNVTADADIRDTQSLFDETLDGDQDTSPAIFLIGWGNPTFDTDYAVRPWIDPEDAFGISHFNDDEMLDLIAQATELPSEPID